MADTLPTHPLLADTIVDRPEDGTFLVDRALFIDEAIFELELERIFRRTWIYLGHESQLPKPGDFITNEVARVPVMLVRGKTGAIKAFLNSCAHRGAALCRTERGNAKTLACGYHGWCYDLDGKNVYVKDKEAGAYPESFDQRSRDLTPLARFDSYRGFLFGCLSPDVEDLEAYLGEARASLDLMVDQAPEGLEVLRGASTYRYRGNWKLQAENGVDGYHFTTVHANWLQILAQRAAGTEDNVKAIDGRTLLQMKSGAFDLGNGHNLIWAELPNPPDRPLWERRPDLVRRLGETTAQWMVNRMRNLLLYPSVLLMDQASTQIRAFRPISASETEVKIHCIAPIGESAGARERRIRQYEDFFNASGMATPDDLAEFEACQSGYRARRECRWVPYDRGTQHTRQGANDEARSLGISPVASGENIQDETLFQGQYRRWSSLMATDPAAQEAVRDDDSARTQRRSSLS